MDNLLETARTLVYSDRAMQYGDIEAGFSKAAAISSIITGKSINAHDVVKILISLKLARESMNHKRDNLIDAAGYLDILDQLEGRE